jgi:hypothetical protein
MKKYKIELSEHQMMLIANCLEDLSRFASGQSEMRYTVEEMLRGLSFDEQMKKRDEVEELLKKAKRVLLPNFPDNASKGYNGSEFIGNTYQIYRSILYQLAKDNNWNNVYSSPALPSGNLGTIKIELVDVKQNTALQLQQAGVIKSVCEHKHISGGYFGGDKYIVKCKDCDEIT